MANAAFVGSGPRLRNTAPVIVSYSVTAGTVIVWTAVSILVAVKTVVLGMLISQAREKVEIARTCKK